MTSSSFSLPPLKDRLSDEERAALYAERERLEPETEPVAPPLMSLDEAAAPNAHLSDYPQEEASKPKGTPIPDALLLHLVTLAASLGIEDDLQPIFQAQLKDPNGITAQSFNELKPGEALAHYGICLPGGGDGESSPRDRLLALGVGLAIGVTTARLQFDPEKARAALQEAQREAKQNAQEETPTSEQAAADIHDTSGFGAW